jgi:DNA-binding CsgD family transcriptional regulator
VSAGAPGAPLDVRPAYLRLQALALAGDPRFARLGSVEQVLGAGIGGEAAKLRRSVLHMTHVPVWEEVRLAQPLVARGGRSLDVRYVTSEPSLRRLPMLSSHHHPYLRVGPVVGPLLVTDRNALYIGAPLGHELAGQVWASRNPQLVEAAVRCFELTWASAVPAVPAGEEPPFTRRMVEIGFLLTDGASDREIARALHVSERTVSADVAEVVRRLGARSRGHAIALIGGGVS